MKTQLAMVIDSSSCIDCKACMVSCKVENKVPGGYWRNWVKQREPRFGKIPGAKDPAAQAEGCRTWIIQAPDFDKVKGYGDPGSMHFQPGGCMHCANPACVQACPTGATYKDEKDGTVRLNDKLCIGCGCCIPACPYGARYRHPEKKIVDKCDFCAKRRERGELPACVITCPTKARTFGNINDPESDVARLVKENKTVRVVNEETDTKPNMYYVSTTAPMNWPRKAESPTPIRWWASLAKPLVWAVVGLNALGVLVMFGKQLIIKDEETEK